MTEPELHAMVRMLQALTPLKRLSNMEARAVFELLLSAGTSSRRRRLPKSILNLIDRVYCAMEAQ